MIWTITVFVIYIPRKLLDIWQKKTQKCTWFVPQGNLIFYFSFDAVKFLNIILFITDSNTWTDEQKNRVPKAVEKDGSISNRLRPPPTALRVIRALHDFPMLLPGAVTWHTLFGHWVSKLYIHINFYASQDGWTLTIWLNLILFSTWKLHIRNFNWRQFLFTRLIFPLFYVQGLDYFYSFFSMLTKKYIAFMRHRLLIFRRLHYWYICSGVFE